MPVIKGRKKAEENRDTISKPDTYILPAKKRSGGKKKRR